MVEKKDAWNITCNRFVAFLDIMGFKDMVLRKNQSYVENKLETFQFFLSALNKAANNSYDTQTKKAYQTGKEPKHSAIRPVVFSDSIILISNDDSLNSALTMLYNVGWVIARSIHFRVPLKGAIAYGEQTSDFIKSMHFGIPLIDAYELQNELYSYGVILHHTMESRLIELNEISKPGNILFQYPVPMKTGKITHYIVNWTMFPKIDKHLEKSVTELYNTVSGAPRKYVDNTLEFVKWVTAKKTELAQQKTKETKDKPV